MGRKGALAPFLVILTVVLILPAIAAGAERKARRPAAKATAKAAPAKAARAPEQAAVSDANLYDSLKTAEDRLEKGKTDDALRLLTAVHGYTADNLKLMACVGEAYDKARKDPALKQDEKETIYIKQQRMGMLAATYEKVRSDSAYDLALAYVKKGDAPQARKYLIEVCRTAPFSLDPASVWAKSKDLFLKISNLEGEF